MPKEEQENKKETLARLYRETRDMYDACKKIIEKEGMTYNNVNGSVCLRPEVKQLNVCRTHLLRLSRELGVTGDVVDTSDLEAFLNS